MNNPLVKPLVKKPAQRLLVALLPFIFIMSTSAWLLNIQLKQSMTASTTELAHQLQVKTDAILSHSENTYLSLINYLDKPCAPAVIEEMQNVVAEGLYLRNTSFFRHGKIYCSSTPEVMGMPIRSAQQFTDGKMLLFTDTFVTQGVPLIASRFDKGDSGIVSIIDGRYLQNVLELNNKDSKLISYLKLGDSWIEASGEVHNSPLPTLDFVTDLRAKDMPLHIIVGLKTMALWKRLWSEYWLVICSVFLASSAVSILTYHAVSRPRSTSKVLSEALKRKEFIPYLQGVVDKSGALCGAEVLMRWRSGGGELVQPDRFIPAAEKSGLIVAMTSSMLPPLQDYFLEHRDLLPPGFCLNINISKDHFACMALVDECRQFLKPFPLNSLTLCLEITERELIDQTDQTDELLRRLNEIGVKIAIDDFGTGHASFNYLQRFKVDFIKIDKGFVNSIGTESVSASLVDIILDMGQKLGMDVIAEGVELEQQSNYLSERNISKMQGYYYSKPVPLEEFTELLQNRNNT